MRKEIKLLAEGYSIGDQSELLRCPSCNGGVTGENSFTINVTPEGILFVCYRAKCGIKGFVPNHRYSKVLEIKKRPTKPFLGDISPIPDDRLEFFCNRFPLMTQEIVEREGIQWSNERSRYLLPLLTIEGLQYGLTARSYTSDYKVISYFDNTEVPKIHFPVSYNTELDYTVIVEDQISAMILCSYGINAAAITGTNFNDQLAEHLASNRVKTLIFYLDLDAVNKAFKYKKQFSFSFSCFTFFHKKDPKDLNRAELETLRQLIHCTGD